jgi:hypothetical protein
VQLLLGSCSLERGQIPSQSSRFAEKGGADALKLIRTKREVTAFVQANFEPAHACASRQPGLGNPESRALLSDGHTVTILVACFFG